MNERKEGTKEGKKEESFQYCSLKQIKATEKEGEWRGLVLEPKGKSNTICLETKLF